jgi:hypothetical protein
MSNSSTKTRFSIPLENHYTPSSVGALYFTTPNSPSATQSARQASARAILRHDVSLDNKHLSVRRKGGLHPMYIALHGNGESDGPERKEITHLLDESRKDIFDAVSVASPSLICFFDTNIFSGSSPGPH